MNLSKKHEKQIEIQAKRLKNMYESPSKEVEELLKKVNESPTMPSGMTREEEVNLIFQKSQEYVNEQNKQIMKCPEFHYFGANYPDAVCIDGYLWDLDSAENGCLTIGGEEPCPFCNTEKFIEQNEDEENTRELLLAHIESLRQRYGNKEK